MDKIVRGIAADDMIRCFAIYSRDMVEEAKNRHQTSPVITAALGRLMSAGAMMGTMMKGDKDILTLKIDCSGPVQGITVTADSKGNVKGYPKVPNVSLPANSMGKLDVAGALGLGVLTVIKDMGLREPYNGSTHLVSSEIAEDLTYYFATSEQTPSSVALGVLMNKDNTVAHSGGYIIQLMPDTPDEIIDRLEAKLKNMESVTELYSQGHSPESMLEYILGDFDLKITDECQTQFKCGCSQEKVSNALISLGKKELQNMLEDGEPVEVNCHFCNTSYRFDPEDIKNMIDA